MNDRGAIECMNYLYDNQHSILFKSLVGKENREIIAESVQLAISALQEREERSKYLDDLENLLNGQWVGTEKVQKGVRYHICTRI